MTRTLPFLIISALFVAAMSWGASLYRAAKPMRLTTKSDPVVMAGAKGAPQRVVAIELYGDYQCPPCGELHPVLQKLQREYGPKMNVTFFHLPLVDIHPHALEAAIAATAAERQGKFVEMHNMLYDNQSIWADAADFRPFAVRFAKQLGLDVDRFTKDLDDPQVREVVAVDRRRAAARGIRGTPTVIVDGRMIDYDDPTEPVLRREIERSLQGVSRPRMP